MFIRSAVKFRRLLEKEKRFFCVQCIATEAFLILREKREPEHPTGKRSLLSEEANTSPRKAKHFDLAMNELPITITITRTSSKIFQIKFGFYISKYSFVPTSFRYL